MVLTLLPVLRVRLDAAQAASRVSGIDLPPDEPGWMSTRMTWTGRTFSKRKRRPARRPDSRVVRIIAEELRRQGWTEADLGERRKSYRVKLGLAARLRRETTLTVGWIASRLQLEPRKSAAVKLHRWTRDNAKTMV
jgi:hypothetical protein